MADANRVILEGARRKYGLTDSWALGTFCLIAVLMGAGFDTDPLYPWLGRELGRYHDIGPKHAVMNVSALLVEWFEAAVDEVKNNDIN